MKVAVVLGTRPEIIKMAPVLRELASRHRDTIVIHTDQHYSANMDQVFWDQLGVMRPTHHLGVRASGHSAQTAEMLTKVGELLAEERPDWVLVHGDTNSTLAGGLAAAKIHGIKLAHVEAGLRSFDRTMPEEVNRVVVDHLSDLLFAPTDEAVKNLLNEGIDPIRIRKIGNTIEDSVRTYLPQALATSQRPLGFKRRYGVLTLHRAENTTLESRFARILGAVFEAAELSHFDLVFPVHPRTKQVIDRLGMVVPSHVHLIEPMGYFEFLRLMSDSCLIVTDSGGLQEEACLLSKPCVTLRENTERPETLRLGCNVLAGTTRDGIRGAIQTMMVRKGPWESPYGKGLASSSIVDAIESLSGGELLANVEALDQDVTVLGVETESSTPGSLERGRLR